MSYRIVDSPAGGFSAVCEYCNEFLATNWPGMLKPNDLLVCDEHRCVEGEQARYAALTNQLCTLMGRWRDPATLPATGIDPIVDLAIFATRKCYESCAEELEAILHSNDRSQE